MDILEAKTTAYSLGRAMIERSIMVDSTELDRIQGQVAVGVLQNATMGERLAAVNPTGPAILFAALGSRPIPKPVIVGADIPWLEAVATLQELEQDRQATGSN